MTLATQSDFAVQLAEFDKIQATCKQILNTKHYQAFGEAGIHAIMARAKALGIHPFEALNGGFTCIQGKVGMSTEMMAALVRQRGHSIMKDPKSNGEVVILHGKRADNGDTWTCTFSKDDAIAAGLWNSSTWKKYPSVMLYNRCMSQLFRQLFPDLSLGAGYVEDELKEITRSGEYANVKQLDIAEVEEIKPSKINAERALEVEALLAQVPPEVAKGCMEWVKQRGFPLIGDMTPEFFEEVKTKLRLKIESLKKASAISGEKEENPNE
ncbi:MAG: hypothetical protein A3F13_02520 [Gammaproteobacteria bacterium RIFCSPHIGHO2_12_FULL_40_19]|nr:MAG: hypothetical protein A3F13_02520 [Gammaproteobacteria bacterium RIFCSPHIGHO2_12_FULL_40_19]